MDNTWEFPQKYRDFIRDHGAPSALRRDNAQEECSEEVDKIHQELFIKDQFSEPGMQQQNPVESCGVRYIKQHVHVLLDRTGAPDAAWYHGSKYLADVCSALDQENLTYSVIEKISDVVQDAHLIENKIIIKTESDNPDYQWTVANPIQIQGEEQRPAIDAPALGEHSREILLQSGYTTSEIDELCGLGIVKESSWVKSFRKAASIDASSSWCLALIAIHSDNHFPNDFPFL